MPRNHPRAISGTVGRALLFWLATMAILAIASPIAGHGTHAGLIIGALTAPATFALTIVLIRWDGKGLSDYCFGLTRATWLRLAAGLLFGALLIGAQTAIIISVGAAAWTGASPTISVPLAALSYLLLATREELAFRGFTLRQLAFEIGDWPALIIVSILFVIEHRLGGSTWTNAIIGSGTGGLVFGMAALATRGLAFPIGLHAAWNIGDWARGTKGDGGLWHVTSQPGSEHVMMASYVGVMALAFGALWIWWWRTDHPRR